MISDERLETLANGRWLSAKSSEIEGMARELLTLRNTFSEPAAYMTYKGYLIHAEDPKLAEYSDPEPLFMRPE